MQMTPDEYAARFPDRPPSVPLEYAGQWIAWNEDHTEIVAHGGSLSEVRKQAMQHGCTGPVFQKIPRGLLLGRAGDSTQSMSTVTSGNFL